MSDALSQTVHSPARILRLSIERYRGIQNLVWRPGANSNVIIGGGDVGKTTILEAIGVLLAQTNSNTVFETDYYHRDTSLDFSIEGVIALPPTCGIEASSRTLWPWEWNGTDPVVPTLEGSEPNSSIPVYRIRARGTPEFDLVHEILQPDGTAIPFPATIRRAIGLVRLLGEDRNDRDLRLVQGSALDRLLGDKSLRSRLTCQSASNWDPLSAFKRAPFDRRALGGALGLSEPAWSAPTGRALVA